MSDSRIDRPRDEHIYVPRIEKDKKEKEKFTPIPADNAKKILFASFFSYITNLFNTFSPSKKMTGKLIDQQVLIHHLQILKNLLQKLMEADTSNSADFAYALSNTWHYILDDFENLEILERKNLGKIASFREMIQAIKNYPAGSEHRLGYYLIMQAGKNWLPFPFIEILSQLHKNHKNHLEKSILHHWIQNIDKVIADLQIKPFSEPLT